MMEQAAIAGSAAEGVYSQTYTTGNFFIVLSLSGDEAVDKELGRNTLAKIEEMVTQTPDTQVKDIVEIVNDEFKNGIKINLVIAKIQSQKLTLAGVGEVSAKLIRQGKSVNLLAKSAGGDDQIANVSGPVFHKDLLIVGTDGFFSLLTNEDLIGHDQQPVTELRDVLLPKIEGIADNSKVAALLIRVDLISHPPEEMIEEQLPSVTEMPSTSPIPVRNLSFAPILDRFKSKYLSKVVGPRGLYLKNHYGENGSPISRRSIYLAIVVLITLVCLIAFQLRSRSMELSAKNIATMEKQAQDSIDSAQKLSGVNDSIARDILVQSRKDLVSKIEVTFGPNWQKSANGSKLKAVLANLDAKITVISHIYNVAELPVFYDFGLLKSGVRVVSADLEKNEIFALDNANGAAYSVGTKNKTAAILTGSEDLKSAKYISGIGDNVYVFSPGGLTRIDRSTTPTSSKQVAGSSDKWGEIRGLKTFAGNLYLLDATNNQVWKYQGTESGFADVAPYLKSGSLDFSKVVSLAIDGYIYVLSNSGNVVRFASGYADEFKLTGLPDPLTSPVSFFVSDETENIYILDNNGSRVTVTDKKGIYLAEYVLPGPVTGTLLADESVKKVFLISGDKVFSFDLH